MGTNMWAELGLVCKKVSMESEKAKNMSLPKHSNLDHSGACIMIKVFQKSDNTAKTN